MRRKGERNLKVRWIMSLGLVMASLAGTPASAADVHHHLALFAGGGVESKEGRQDEPGFALGVEYELRFHKHWGVGGVIEGLGQETIRNVLVVVPVSFHPGGHWRLIAGPGVEFTPKKDKFAFRLGVGYEIPLGGHWSLAPEFFLDLIESGENTWLAGVALGYEF